MSRTVPTARTKVAFTLIELLVVIAIVLLLAAILLPVLQRARATAKRAVCVSNLRQQGLAIVMYADDYNRSMPPGNSNWDQHLNAFSGGVLVNPGLAILYAKGYAPSKNVFYCPGYWHNGALYGATYTTDGDSYSSPAKGWPDATGTHLRFGYMWYGGYEWGCGVIPGQHVPISLTHEVLSCYPGNVVAIADPSRVSPLVDIVAGDVSGYAQYSHTQKGSTPEGSNHWYLDGHVAWIPGSQLFDWWYGPNYHYWQSYEPYP